MDRLTGGRFSPLAIYRPDRLQYLPFESGLSTSLLVVGLSDGSPEWQRGKGASYLGDRKARAGLAWPIWQKKELSTNYTNGHE